jgi:hypothetical protein
MIAAVVAWVLASAAIPAPSLRAALMLVFVNQVKSSRGFLNFFLNQSIAVVSRCEVGVSAIQICLSKEMTSRPSMWMYQLWTFFTRDTGLPALVLT